MLVNEKRVHAALKFAARWHKGQWRTVGIPYITHPVDVTSIIIACKGDFGENLEEAVIAGALHDVREDTKCPEGLIRSSFGERVDIAVSGLSKDTVAQLKSKDLLLLDSLERSERVGPWVVGVKGADRISNLNPLTVPPNWSREKRILYVDRDSAMILWAVRRAGLKETGDMLEHAMKVYREMIPPA